jgi:hypothetical protein
MAFSMKNRVFEVSRLACDVLVESLESRVLLSVSGTPTQLSPAMIEQAYDLKNITFRTGGKTVSANGAGETIAIVDAFGDPNITNDLQTFDSNFGIGNDNASGQFVLTVATPEGAVTTDAAWASEESLDVEWAHAIAPQANILLVESASASVTDLINAVVWAASQTGVTAVSMSWGINPDLADETADDPDFTTPSGHTGVTFVAGSGDNGQLNYPSISPNVLSVGGTTLTVDASGNFISESAWSLSGGGHSSDEGTNTPDVAYDANPSTGFLVYDSIPNQEISGWQVIGGTSAGAPQWAAIVALVDQGRSLLSLGSLDGPTQAVPEIDSLPSGDFNDVTGGGFTGLGSPVGEKVISALVGGGITSGAPTSTISPLSATETTPSFTVQWSGSDYAGGSGVASYSIYVSDNGRPFALWLSNTTLTSATFTGTPGQTYGFYSIATDNVGNVQPTPSGAQATTTITVPVIGSLLAAPNPVTAGNSITLTASSVNDTGGMVTSISFYEETNGIPGLQTGAGGDTLISTDTTSPYSATFSTTGLAANTYTFYAQAIDNHSSLSTVVSTTDQIQPASGTATRVIVDDKAATLVGTWTSSTYTAGFYGTDYLTDGNTAKGTKTATFTPTLTAAGNYNVYARWTVGPTRATNVPFFVTWNGGSATISENEQINNGTWVLLGTWNFAAGTSGSVQVRTTGTNGYVIADAVEFVPAPAASTVIMPVTGPGVTVTGSWTASTFTPGFIGSDYLTDGNNGKGTKNVRFTPTLAAGSYQVYAHWEAGTNRATNVPITINSASGATTVTENQQLNNDTWLLLGTFTFNATGGSVVISNTGTNGYVIADGIQFVPA